MLAVVEGTTDPLYMPFAIATHVYYCWPFMRQRGATRLARDYVPPEHIGLHDAMTSFRDKLFAHCDADVVNELQRPLTGATFRAKPGTTGKVRYADKTADLKIAAAGILRFGPNLSIP
jgi:hypothetical protein